MNQQPHQPGAINTSEELTPRRLWLIARKGLEHGWSPTIHTVPTGFKLILTELYHCVHVLFVPADRRAGEHSSSKWTANSSQCQSRCPQAVTAQDARVRMSDLTLYLETHPAECGADTGPGMLTLWERVDAEDPSTEACVYHLPIEPYGARP